MLKANGSSKTCRLAREQTKYSLLGVRLDNMTATAAAEQITSAVVSGTGGVLINPNIDVLRQATSSPSLQALVNEADLVVADGAPLVWASRIAGDGRTHRVPGADLIWTLTSAARSRDQQVFLLGGAPGIAAMAAEKLTACMPDLAAVASFSPPFGLEQTEDGFSEIVSELRAANAKVVFCAFGFPKQERLISRLRPYFPDVWFIGSGASITFVAGVVPRAPRWMREVGIEWIHRLATEPRRLFRRYVIDDLPFAASMFIWAAIQRIKGEAYRPASSRDGIS
jgi:N-acetylglucosaminyldiphosphoundecaprenol N-acetyl-beta-D-mannosaminyltransferase